MLDTTRLDLLLADLRHAGLVVGVREMDRLHQVFSQLDATGGSDATAPERLHSILTTVLVKTRDQKPAFDDAFKRWQQQAEADLESLDPSVPDPRPSPLLSVPKPARRAPRLERLRWPMVVVVGVLVLTSLGLGGAILQVRSSLKYGSVVIYKLPSDSSSEETLEESIFEEETVTPARQRTTTRWKPVVSVQYGTPSDHNDPTRFLPLIAVLGTVLLRRVPVRPARTPVDTSSTSPSDEVAGAAPRALLSAPTGVDDQLLDRRQREMMVWGLDHYVAEGEVSRHLDVPASVDATARAGGLLRLHRRPPRHLREVWLWLDGSCEDPAAAQLVDEVQQALEAQRLPVRRATFWGLPDPLTDADGNVFRPREMEEHRQRARVVLLTDGRLLCQQHARGDRRGHLTARLRELSHWPRLAVVDFSGDDDGLSRLLRQHHLQRLTPDALPGFVGGRAVRRAARHVTDEAIWTAATALCPAPFEAGTAHALAEALDLRVSPWAFRRLRRLAPGPGERLEWTWAQRVEQLEWLRTVEAQNDVGGSTFQQRAVQFWLRHYDTESARRSQADPAWQETRAARLLQAERWLLALFSPDPRQEAIGVLWRLFHHGEAVRDWLRRQLGHLTTLDDPRPDLARLGIALNALHPTERNRLFRMGLAPRQLEETSRQPARRELVWGLMFGVVMGTLLWTIAHYGRLDFWVRPPGSEALSAAAEPGVGALPMTDPRAELVTWRQEMGEGRWAANVAMPDGQERRIVEAENWLVDYHVDVAWALDRQAPCVETQQGLEVWRCPGRPPLQRMSRLLEEESGQASRIVLGILSPAGDSYAESLAGTLLDSGTADLVLIGEDRQAMTTFGGPADLGLDYRVRILEFERLTNEWKGELKPTPSQLWGYLAVSIWQLEGRKPAHEVWSQANWSSYAGLEFLGEPDPPLVEMVWIPGGTFWMGTREDDPGAELAYDYEKPAREMAVEGFWMARTEVTHAQYKIVRPDHTTYWDEELEEATDDFPVTDVSWHDAKAFCEALGYRLPTEAEWEYAARAGMRTPWSFGDGESQLGDYAWFGEDLSSSVHPVGQKLANPWGLDDMHGNVYEWVEDEYVSYDNGEPIKDVFCDENTTCSVLRGGSYWDVSRDVRSAGRFRIGRGNSFRNFGFRCVRGLPPAAQGDAPGSVRLTLRANRSPRSSTQGNPLGLQRPEGPK